MLVNCGLNNTNKANIINKWLDISNQNSSKRLPDSIFTGGDYITKFQL